MVITSCKLKKKEKDST